LGTKRELSKKLLLYIGRWQLSTPILAVVVGALAYLGYWQSAIIANLIGALIFFWIDRRIFSSVFDTVWQVEENVTCIECGRVARGYRLVKTKNYDRTSSTPEFRCEDCSVKKTNKLRKSGVSV
jgi:DNA-directed RNA polymerase subunit RPC12/RpoP